MKKFEIGKSYTHGWIGDSELFTTWQVIARTAQTITIERCGKIKKCRINKDLSEMFGAEAVKPYGTYSMSPTLTAE